MNCIAEVFGWLVGVVVPTLNVIAWWSILLADKANDRKWIWALIMLLIPFLGAALWLAWGRKYA